eukprot:g4391.t1
MSRRNSHNQSEEQEKDSISQNASQIVLSPSTKGRKLRRESKKKLRAEKRHARSMERSMVMNLSDGLSILDHIKLEHPSGKNMKTSPTSSIASTTSFFSDESIIEWQSFSKDSRKDKRRRDRECRRQKIKERKQEREKAMREANLDTISFGFLEGQTSENEKSGKQLDESNTVLEAIKFENRLDEISNELEKTREEQKREKSKEADVIAHVFAKADKDGNGVISKWEFDYLFSHIFLEEKYISRDNIDAALKAVDIDSDEKLTLPEFRNLCAKLIEMKQDSKRKMESELRAHTQTITEHIKSLKNFEMKEEKFSKEYEREKSEHDVEKARLHQKYDALHREHTVKTNSFQREYETLKLEHSEGRDKIHEMYEDQNREHNIRTTNLKNQSKTLQNEVERLTTLHKTLETQLAAEKVKSKEALLELRTGTIQERLEMEREFAQNQRLTKDELFEARNMMTEIKIKAYKEIHHYKEEHNEKEMHIAEAKIEMKESNNGYTEELLELEKQRNLFKSEMEIEKKRNFCAPEMEFVKERICLEGHQNRIAFLEHKVEEQNNQLAKKHEHINVLQREVSNKEDLARLREGNEERYSNIKKRKKQDMEVVRLRQKEKEDKRKLEEMVFVQRNQQEEIKKLRRITNAGDIVEFIFLKRDADNNGSIDINELHSMLEDFHIYLALEAVQRAIDKSDLDQNGRLTLPEFREVVKTLNDRNKIEEVAKMYYSKQFDLEERLLKAENDVVRKESIIERAHSEIGYVHQKHESLKRKTDQQIKQLQRVANAQDPVEFLFFKRDKDNSGQIDASELHSMLQDLHIDMKVEDVKMVMNDVDLEHTGELTLPEFRNLITAIKAKKQVEDMVSEEKAALHLEKAQHEIHHLQQKAEAETKRVRSIEAMQAAVAEANLDEVKIVAEAEIQEMKSKMYLEYGEMKEAMKKTESYEATKKQLMKKNQALRYLHENAELLEKNAYLAMQEANTAHKQSIELKTKKVRQVAKAKADLASKTLAEYQTAIDLLNQEQAEMFHEHHIHLANEFEERKRTLLQRENSFELEEMQLRLQQYKNELKEK